MERNLRKEPEPEVDGPKSALTFLSVVIGQRVKLCVRLVLNSGLGVRDAVTVEESSSRPRQRQN
jgi:hypothetical protein